MGFDWRRRSESNRRIKVLQTSALPLGYAASPSKEEARATPSIWNGDLAGNVLERETGFEPATSTLARSHSTAELLPLEVINLSNGSVTCQSNEGE